MTHRSFCLILLPAHVCDLVFMKIQPGSRYFAQLWNLWSVNKLNLRLHAPQDNVECCVYGVSNDLMKGM